MDGRAGRSFERGGLSLHQFPGRYTMSVANPLWIEGVML